jgi:hypothetical protein
MSYSRYIEETKRYIEEQRWEEIQRYETWSEQQEGSCGSLRSEMSRPWLVHELLLLPNDAHEGVYHTLMRLFDLTTPVKWGNLFHGLTGLPSIERIRWFIEEKGVVVDWNAPHPRPFLLLAAYLLQGEGVGVGEGEGVGEGDAYLMYLFEQGATPSLLLQDRDPLFLRWITMELTAPLGRKPISDSLRRAELLLRHGADPLLTNDQGTNALDLIRDAHLFTTITREEQEQWLNLLERYV